MSSCQITLGTSSGCSTGWALYQYHATTNTLNLTAGGIHCTGNYVPFNYVGFDDPADQEAAEAYAAAGCDVFFVSCCSSQTNGGAAALMQPPGTETELSDAPTEWRDRVWRLEQTVRQLSQALINQRLLNPGENPDKKVPEGTFSAIRKRICEGAKTKKQKKKS